MKKFHLIILLSLLISACNEEEISKPKSGYFTLTQIQSAVGGRVGSTNEPQIEFNLGELKASKEFFFLLGNGGDNPITDITITTDNPKFILSPNSISSIAGKNSTNNNIIPLISFGAIHGIQLNGFGFTDILEQGTHTIIVKITGKTVENGSIINLLSEFKFTLEALVMSIEISQNNSIIDLSSPYSTTSGVPNAGGLGAVPGYLSFSSIVNIKNTGNVDIRVITKSLADYEVDEDVIIPSGGSHNVSLQAFPESPEWNSTLFSIGANGTIADYKLLQQGNDGNAYFIIN